MVCIKKTGMVDQNTPPPPKKKKKIFDQKNNETQKIRKVNHSFSQNCAIQ